MNKPLFPDVTVNGEAISAADIAAEAQNHDAPSGKPGIAWRKAARALVIRKLLLQEAAKMGLTASPIELIKGQIETEEEALIREMLDIGIEVREPGEEELRAIYNANQSRFRAPTLYEPAHILFPARPEDTEARTEARKMAEAALDILKQKPEEFSRIAKTESGCSSRNSGGQLGQISSGDTVPEFEAALDAMEVGTISAAPVETRYGFHIIRLDAKAIGDVLPYDITRPKLVEMLEKKAWAEGAQKYVERLMNAAEITGVDLRAA